MNRRATHNAPTLYDDHGLLVDNFAGGGGASIGIERGLGRRVDIAINHDREAVSMHRLNHPHTEHLCQDIYEVDPREVCGDRRVLGAWFSPDCTHHSKAKGGKPIRDPQRKSRDGSWVVLRWAGTVKPDIIWLENVEEFMGWGPLVGKRDRATGRVVKLDGSVAAPGEVVPLYDQQLVPCRRRSGRAFRCFVKALRDLGYEVDWRELRACDYGAPTIRKRLFMIARCDGEPIVWPEPTHGPGREPYVPAAACIDFGLECPSIFTRKRPLAANTEKRIAAGIKRFVIDAAEPFIVRIGQTGGNGSYTNSADDPLTTVTTKAEHCLVAPYMVPRYGEADGQSPRCRSVEQPHPTITPTSNGGQLVTAFLARHFGGMTGRELDKPLPTTTARGTQNQVVAAHMQSIANYGGNGSNARPADKPLSTITAWPRGGHHALVAALLVKYYGADQHGQGLREPIHTIPTKERFGLVTVNLNGEPYIITDIGMRMLQPHELYAAQGFPADYIHDHGIDADGRRVALNKTTQVRMCGNSVSPPIAEALVRANVEAAERECVAT